MFHSKRFIGLCVSLLVLSSVVLDSSKTPNALSRILPVISLFEHGHLHFDDYHEMTIDKSYVNGHYYSDKAPLLTFSLIPIYAMVQPVLYESDFETRYTVASLLASFLFGSLPFVWIIIASVKHWTKSESTNTTIPLGLLFFFGSYLYLYAGTFYSHVFAGALMLGGYIQLKEKGNALIAGLLCGAAFLSEFTVALFFPFWTIYLVLGHRQLKKGVLFCLGVAPAIILIAVYNWNFTGNPFTMLYSYVSHGDFAVMRDNLGFGSPKVEAILGLTISDYRGLLIYAPMLAIVLTGLVVSRPSIKSLLLHPLVLSSIFYVLFISSYFMWWGGWSFGPRQLTAMTVLLAYSGIYYLLGHPFKNWQLIAVGAGIFGALISVGAKFTSRYNLPTEVDHPITEVIIPKVMNGAFYQGNWLTEIFGIPAVIILIAWLVVFATTIWYFRKNSLDLR